MNTWRFAFIASVAGAATFATLLSATPPPQIGPNVRVNAILGPDATASTFDDDDPNDQDFVKAHNTTTATVIRSEGDPILFGAWNDWSRFGQTDPNDSKRVSVGYGADDLTPSCPVHDIARAAVPFSNYSYSG